MAVKISRIEPRQNLASELADMLRRQIRSGNMKPGDKLPTEQELIESASVSRTVVREAVAVLRAEGLLVARQGVGVFVSSQLGDQIFRIDADRLEALLKVMELRISVEVEAAALAAQRRTPDQLRALERTFKSFEEEVHAGGTAADQDNAFHAMIGAASGNEYFDGFIRYLISRLFIPGQRIFELRKNRYAVFERTLGIVREHEAILDGIREGSSEKACRSMREHLESSLTRYRAALND